MVQEIGREKEERNGKDRGSVAIGIYTVEHQSTGLECSHWLFWLFMGSVSFYGITVTKILIKTP